MPHSAMQRARCSSCCKTPELGWLRTMSSIFWVHEGQGCFAPKDARTLLYMSPGGSRCPPHLCVALFAIAIAIIQYIYILSPKQLELFKMTTVAGV